MHEYVQNMARIIAIFRLLFAKKADLEIKNGVRKKLLQYGFTQDDHKEPADWFAADDERVSLVLHRCDGRACYRNNLKNRDLPDFTAIHR
jgi:hypothetical protein